MSILRSILQQRHFKEATRRGNFVSCRNARRSNNVANSMLGNVIEAMLRGEEMKALNSKYMTRPKSGIIVKEQRMLATSNYYYRFAHSMVRGKRQNRDMIMSGAWWVDADTFNTIKLRSARSDTHLSAMARYSCAIPRRWEGKVDIVVRALLTGPVLAYYGIGTIQTFEKDDDDDLPVWYPASDIVQIYIPGLWAKNPQTGNKIYADAFSHLEQTRIGWDPM